MIDIIIMDELDKQNQKTLEHLLKAVDRVYHSPKQIAARSFLSGIFTGLGATVGVSIVIGLITFILNQLQLFPIIGEFIEQMRLERVLE